MARYESLEEALAMRACNELKSQVITLALSIIYYASIVIM